MNDWSSESRKIAISEMTMTGQNRSIKVGKLQTSDCTSDGEKRSVGR